MPSRGLNQSPPSATVTWNYSSTAEKWFSFFENYIWVKKDNPDFDVTMEGGDGGLDSAEVCKLVALYIISQMECGWPAWPRDYLVVMFNQEINFSEGLQHPNQHTPLGQTSKAHDSRSSQANCCSISHQGSLQSRSSSSVQQCSQVVQCPATQKK